MLILAIARLEGHYTLNVSLRDLWVILSLMLFRRLIYRVAHSNIFIPLALPTADMDTPLSHLIRCLLHSGPHIQGL